jgi:hypothetical protein
MSLTAGCATSQASGKPAWATCTSQVVPVTLSPTDTTVYHLSGQLCHKSDKRRGDRTVQLLVSGLTFDHNYWDVRYQPNTYSYVYAATNQGYSTFNIDRLGVGASDHPPADALTLQAHAYTIAQIVAQLRAGGIGGIAFQTVVGVGHSLGAGILQYEAGTVTDPRRVPDYLILADYLSQTVPKVVAQIGAALYPAEQDLRFAAAGLPAGYLTTRPDTRADLFFHPRAADSAAITFDESTKQTTTLAERTTVGAARELAVTRAIRVPVLITVGHDDGLDCDDALGLSCATADAVLAREASHFSAPACLRTFVVPDAGHATNLHRRARDGYNFGNDWLDRYTITDTGRKDANGCL